MTIKEEIKKLFEDSFLPTEILAKERYDYFLKESSYKKANVAIKKIRDDEIRHIAMVKRVIEIASRKS
ncbi:MAG: hypothetical protein AAB851_04065 [Patescibacteria group bacterium]